MAAKKQNNRRGTAKTTSKKKNTRKRTAKDQGVASGFQTEIILWIFFAASTDPHHEKHRQRIEYKPLKEHDYSVNKPSLREIKPGHFINCNDEEFERYKMQFKGKNALFLGYIATIAVPWQAYMVPQFMMMSSWHLNNTHLAIMCLQAFSAFGVFLMKQFYEGVPTELCEAARIDGLSEYGIWWHIMLPLSLPALSTLTIFTFVNTWNDFLGPLIYLTKTELKTIQIGLRMFITQYSAEYGLIMAASVVALIPVLIVFLSLQKYFVQGVASTGIKG